MIINSYDDAGVVYILMTIGIAMPTSPASDTPEGADRSKADIRVNRTDQGYDPYQSGKVERPRYGKVPDLRSLSRQIEMQRARQTLPD
jgi:hypothetical protein